MYLLPMFAFFLQIVNKGRQVKCLGLIILRNLFYLFHSEINCLPVEFFVGIQHC